MNSLDRMHLGIQAKNDMMNDIRQGLALSHWNGRVPFEGHWQYYQDPHHPFIRYYGFEISNGAIEGIDIAAVETAIGVWWRLVWQRGIIAALEFRQWLQFLHVVVQQQRLQAIDENNDSGK